MKLRFERTVAGPPERAWSYLTDPARMNEWSEAEIAPVAPGADGRHDSEGARRRVTVRAFGFRSVLEELVVEVERPRRFGYRVVEGGALRNHRGEITLEETGDKTRVVWEISFDAAVPGLAPLLGRLLTPRLERSLAALGAVLARE